MLGKKLTSGRAKLISCESVLEGSASFQPAHLGILPRCLVEIKYAGWKPAKARWKRALPRKLHPRTTPPGVARVFHWPPLRFDLGYARAAFYFHDLVAQEGRTFEFQVG